MVKQDLKRLAPVAWSIRRVQHRDLRSEDVLLASYPKSGNTWVRFMVAQLLAGREVGWDDLGDVVPMVDRTRFATVLLPDGGRVVKTHDQMFDPYRTPGRRAVNLVRDGRDVATSYYHHQLREGTFEGSFDSYLDRFLKGHVDRYGTWMSHVRSWSTGTEPALVATVRYEDLLTQPRESLAEICSFLGVPVGDGAIDEAVDRNRRDRMRAKERDSSYLASRSVREGTFVRSASSGSWRHTFTDSQYERFMSAAGDVLLALGYEA